VRTSVAEDVRSRVREAVAWGAKQLIDEKLFAASTPGTPYLAPQVLTGVDHSMAIMREETFTSGSLVSKVLRGCESATGVHDDAHVISKPHGQRTCFAARRNV